MIITYMSTNSSPISAKLRFFRWYFSQSYKAGGGAAELIPVVVRAAAAGRQDGGVPVLRTIWTNWIIKKLHKWVEYNKRGKEGSCKKNQHHKSDMNTFRLIKAKKNREATSKTNLLRVIFKKIICVNKYNYTISWVRHPLPLYTVWAMSGQFKRISYGRT